MGFEMYLDKAAIEKVDSGHDVMAINALLAAFGLSVCKVIEAVTTVTFMVLLKPETNIRLVKRLNFAVALNSPGIVVKQEGAFLSIQKPLDGRSVCMGNLYTEAFKKASLSRLEAMAGVCSNGAGYYFDLSAAPHVLVCGGTGSGKSMFVHQVICSLLMGRHDIEWTAIDMKGTEFNNYSVVPGFRVVTETRDAVNALKGLCSEMDRRYREIASAGNRDIESYNAAGGSMKRSVCVIDEFADLMLSCRAAVEPLVVRLAQKARACGIHLIVSTQYPKANVVTGLVKANVPTRACFRLESAVQSRVAIDRNGAELLRGKGDMLFLANGAMEPLRIQGCHVSEVEISNVAAMAARRGVAAA